MTDATTPAEPQSAPLDRIMELQRAGRLASDFPVITALLRELDPAQLRLAGQLLARVDPADIRAAHPSTPVLNVALTGHGTLNTLVPALTAELARHGLLLCPVVSDYNGYVFDLSEPDSRLFAARPDLVVCVLDPMMVFDDIATPWDVPAVAAALAEKERLIEWLVTRFEATSGATLVLNTLPLPRRLAAQLVDHRSRAALGAAWRRTNARLLELPERHPSTVVIDLDPLLAEGIPAEDVRLSTYAKVHLSPELFGRFARELGHLARHLTGRTKKVLAVDLDNTMWGGVLGDDGMAGIQVADSYRGEAFRAFQRVVRQLGSQGVLLTAISKNDIEPVREVLRDHPDMTVREGDFVRVTANWLPKPDNLRETAAVLNLDPDSFVFVDDSPYECGLMRYELPQVSTVQVDAEPALHVERLLADGWFDVRELTTEDRSRPELYRGESARSDFLQEFESTADYLRELRIEVRLTRAEVADIQRVSQITLRTNQFNMTTLRLQPADVQALLADPAALVLTVRARDRFGENGMVGAIFVRREGADAHIENFLLSCRVFSRGIEQACLAGLLEHLRGQGCESVLGAHRATAKNAGVRDLYSRFGFERYRDDGAETTYRHPLRDVLAVPEHVRLLFDVPEKETAL
ncbi:HAD-IIIC family phosphatase [Nocardia sp. SYP-A9097]|uniref:HAD-IIIC family phosphatase n=1 Tax=Nocardia sp. SYP-A9097 TaxID=2663237 RepID=UPI00129BFC62|nr:HAD-IIIC family phosphatase [Nocardia sp. SYP-A9097]MRH92351.1 HAD-IIIC family phosphatase [Nocardia sp. SYP-A9097]